MDFCAPEVLHYRRLAGSFAVVGYARRRRGDLCAARTALFRGDALDQWQPRHVGGIGLSQPALHRGDVCRVVDRSQDEQLCALVVTRRASGVYLMLVALRKPAP